MNKERRFHERPVRLAAGSTSVTVERVGAEPSPPGQNVLDAVRDALESGSSEVALFALVDQLRQTGVKRIGRSAIRSAAREALFAHRITSSDEADLEAVRVWLATRLRTAGLRPPTYDEYTGTAVLSRIGAEGDARQSATGALAFIVEGFEVLLSDEMTERLVPGVRKKTKAHLEKVVAAAGQALFAGRDMPHDVMLPVFARVTLLPETDIAEEPFFLRVVQVTDALFAGLTHLLEDARKAASFGDLADSVLHLDRAELVAELLLPVWQVLLSALPIEAWLRLRPGIIDPSAVQGGGLPDVLVELHAGRVPLAMARIAEASRLDRHPRIATPRSMHSANYRRLLRRIEELVRGWRAAHPAAVRRFNGTGPEAAASISWLREQAGEEGGAR